MTVLRFVSRSLAAAALLAFVATPAFAQANVSDITGPNVSDITGPNVSDITGSNVSDITGPNPAGAVRAAEAGLSQADVNDLADRIGEAYETCAGGGDCGAINTLLDQSSYILTGE